MSILNPDISVAIITVLVLVLTSVILHFAFFRPGSSATTLPTFLLLGPSSTGKTALITTCASSTPVSTRTSQAPLILACDIPASLALSSQCRSTADPSLHGIKRFLIHDTPGHGKLRPAALETIPQIPLLRGVVFVVDASTSEWSDSAEYLHDVLLALQKLQQSKKTSDNMFRVLVACNKADLFTALPAAKIKVLLGEEVGKVREAKSRGIVGMGNEDRDDAEDEWLGIVGSRKQFEFKELEEVGIEVEFAGGSTANGKSWKATLETWFGGAL